LLVRSFAGISLRHQLVMSLATASATYIQKSVTMHMAVRNERKGLPCGESLQSSE